MALFIRNWGRFSSISCVTREFGPGSSYNHCFLLPFQSVTRELILCIEFKAVSVQWNATVEVQIHQAVDNWNANFSFHTELNETN